MDMDYAYHILRSLAFMHRNAKMKPIYFICFFYVFKVHMIQFDFIIDMSFWLVFNSPMIFDWYVEDCVVHEHLFSVLSIRASLNPGHFP